jgi:hypothetical protein
LVKKSILACLKRGACLIKSVSACLERGLVKKAVSASLERFGLNGLKQHLKILKRVEGGGGRGGRRGRGGGEEGDL